MEMFVAGLVLDQNTNAPIVLLKEQTGKICLPIWIGLPEATAIASALKQVTLTRPMTHDLLANSINMFGAKVTRVIIHAIQDNTFLARIELTAGDALKLMDARPSDAIALAVRVNAKIFVSEEVLKQAQVTLSSAIGGEGGEIRAEDEEFTASTEGATDFSAIEKDKWAEILAEMDPDDFKYKQ
ncbi:bifunctional nuclease family protein [bacterium]|nr:bifunctional nuclease family protein [bacterium]